MASENDEKEEGRERDEGEEHLRRASLEGGYDGSWRYAPRAVMLLGHHRTISEATSLRRNSRHVSRYINASASAKQSSRAREPFYRTRSARAFFSSTEKKNTPVTGEKSLLTVRGIRMRIHDRDNRIFSHSKSQRFLERNARVTVDVSL